MPIAKCHVKITFAETIEEDIEDIYIEEGAGKGEILDVIKSDPGVYLGETTSHQDSLIKAGLATIEITEVKIEEDEEDE